MIATILAGNRTELAYWAEAAPVKELTIHQGRGTLILGKPDEDETMPFNLDAEITPAVILPSARFYTFEAAPWTPVPLVVSGLYDIDQPVNWGEMEIVFEPGQVMVEAPEGTIQVPNEFRTLFEQR